MQRIAIDMDEVLADTAAHQLAWYERDFGPGLTMADLHGKHFHTLVPEAHRSRIREHLHHPAFFRDIPLMPGAVDAIRTLSSRFEIFVASAAMEHPVSFTSKYEWLREHFPDIAPSHCVFCGDKSVLGVDYLIDDSPYQLVRFRGEPIIFSAPHNVHETRFRRVEDWPDAVAQLMGTP
ncbi:MAG: 5'-3'-deoxyribonucleotidase [Gemmatimonadaceae bacterium]|nr:5'-3'-deoxyribonucleotidase [Gemmatimonadaceae bacterium]